MSFLFLSKSLLETFTFTEKELCSILLFIHIWSGCLVFTFLA